MILFNDCYGIRCESYSGKELYLVLGEIEYLRSLYKKYSYFDVLNASDFLLKEQWLHLKKIDLPIKIDIKLIEEEGIDKCLKKIKKNIISCIKSDKHVFSYEIEKGGIKW